MLQKLGFLPGFNKQVSETNKFDGRPFPGLPAWFKGFTLPKK